MSRTAAICLCSIDERRAAVKGPSQAQLQNRLETSPKCRLGSEADIAVGQRDVLYSPKADIPQRDWHVRYVPKADISLPHNSYGSSNQ
jgi:hypothetical protein